MINLSDNASNQLSKFRTKKWIKISDDSNGTYNTNKQIKFKTAMLKSSLCHYSDSYILVKGTKTITGAGDNAGVRKGDERNKGVIPKNWEPFTDYILEISNTQIENTKYNDVAMPMSN